MLVQGPMRFEGGGFMHSFRKLTTVSVIALTAGFSTAAVADPQIRNVVIDLTSPTLDLATEPGALQAVSSSSNVNLGSTITAATSGALASNAETVNDTGNTANVDLNEFFSTTIGNQAFSEFDPGALTGAGPDGNGGLSEIRSGNRQGTTFFAEALGEHVNTLDLDAGAAANTFTLDGNSITADVTGNEALNFIGIDIDIPGVDAPADPVVGSDITSGYNNDERGQAGNLLVDADELQASASILALTLQVNDDLEGTAATDETYSQVSGMIGIRVDDDDADDVVDVVGTTISATGNDLTARFEGNDAQTRVNLTAGNTNLLEASVGAYTAQLNQTAGDEAFNAEVTESFIFAGTESDPIEDLDGSTLSFNENSLSADVQANLAVTDVDITGLSVQGPGEETETGPLAEPDFLTALDPQRNIFNRTQADLFARTTQTTNGTDITADVGAGSELRVETGSVGLAAGSGSTVNANDNSVTAFAGANASSTTLDVTEANSIEAIAAVSVVQSTGRDGNITVPSTLAASIGDITNVGQVGLFLDVAQGGATDEITASTVTADGNVFTTSARGNEADARLNLQATTIDSDAFPGATNPVNNLTDSEINADFSLLVDQNTSAYNISAETLALVDADFGTGTPDVTDSALSVSDNLASAETISALVSEAAITLSGNTISGTAGIQVNQIAADGVTAATDMPSEQVSIVGADGLSFIDVDADVGAFSNSELAVDRNEAWAVSFGVAANAVLTVEGTTVDDNGQVEPVLLRDERVNPENEARAGFNVLRKQQTVSRNTQDGGRGLVARVDGSAIVDVLVESTDVTNAEISASDNRATALVVETRGSTVIDIDATTLDASVGALTDMESFDNAAFVDVTADVVSLTVDSGDADIDGTSIAADRNVASATARQTVGSNTVSVTAQTMVLSDTRQEDPAAVDQIANTAEAGYTDDFANASRGEVSILDAQYAGDFDDVNFTSDRVEVAIGPDAGGVTVDIDTTAGFVDSTATANNNVVSAALFGNDGTNVIELDVGSFDLSDAEAAGAPARGPVATIVSLQHIDIEPDTVTLNQPNGVLVDLDGVEGNIERATLSADGNLFRSQAGFQTVRNTISVSSTTFATQDDTVASAASLATATPGTETADGRVGTIGGSSFGIINRQIGAGPLGSFPGGVSADFGPDVVDLSVKDGIVGGVGDVVDQSSLSVSENAVQVLANMSDAANLIELDFATSDATAHIVNLQGYRFPGSVRANPTGNLNMSLDVDGTVTDSSLLMNDNSVLFDASAFRADNTILVSGTVLTGHFDTNPAGSLPSVLGREYVDPTNPPMNPTLRPSDLTVTGGYGIVNHQGYEDPVNVEAIDSSRPNLRTEIQGSLDTSTLQVDNNTIVASAVMAQATNTLGLNAAPDDASAVVGVSGDAVSASIASRQWPLGANATASLGLGASISTLVSDISADGGVSMSVNSNLVNVNAALGTHSSVLLVDAGASITGADGVGGANNDLDPLLALDTDVDLDTALDDFLNADFSVLNQQVTDGSQSSASMGPPSTSLSLTTGSEAVNDTLSVDNNVVNAQAFGFLSDTAVALTAGAVLDATAQAATRQSSTATTVTASIDGTLFDVVLGTTDTSTGSSLSTSENLTRSFAQGQGATNQVIASAGSINSTATEAGPTAPAFGGGSLTVDNAMFAAANHQTYLGGEVTSTIGSAQYDVEAAGLTDSSSDVSGNVVSSTAVVNTAFNAVTAVSSAGMEGGSGLTATVGSTLNVADGDLVVANRQVIGEDAGDFTEVTAEILTTFITAGHDGPLNNSSVAVNDNVMTASAIGNNATNTAIVSAGAGNTLPSVAVVNSQTTTGATISASLSNINIGANGVTGSTGSSASVSNNTVGGSAIGNRSFNSIGGSQ